MSRGGLRIALMTLAVAVAMSAAARPGLVRTLRGEKFSGDVQFTNGLLAVDLTNTVALTNLLQLNFDSETPVETGPMGKGNGLLGFYFANTNFEGNAFVRLDESIHFNWGNGEPAPSLPRDFFSVIWTGEVEAPTNGNFTFHVSADNGARLFLDDKGVAATSLRQEFSEASTMAMALTNGQRLRLKLMYFDFAGDARVRLLWSGPGFARQLIPRNRLFAKSSLPNRSADPLTGQGLLGTYYRNPDLSGESLTRVDAEVNFNWHDRDPVAGFPRNNFGIRWTGQIKADHSQDYTIYVLADEPVRVWIDNRLLIIPSAQFYLTETKESVSLLGGERHDIRIESQSRSAQATFRLMWSSASTPKGVIPNTHLFPSAPTPGLNPGGSAPGRAGKLPPGLLLRNGSFIAGPIERATESSIRAGGLLKNLPISAINVARIICQPLAPSLLARIPAGRAGLLLAKGDFVDADLRELDGTQVRVNSILFGLQTYDLRKDVLAVVLREASPTRETFEIYLRDQSRIAATQLAFEPGRLVIQEPVAGRIAAPGAELLEIRRNN